MGMKRMSTNTFITNKEMEYIAEGILSKAGISINWQGTVNKIDIDALIEFEYGLEIEWRNIDHFASDGVVFAAIIPHKKLIYMNETCRTLFIQKMGTMNFSKAHELGHWILHVIKQQDYKQLAFDESKTYYCRSVTKRSSEEIQADMFAAAILMPRSIISGAINKIKLLETITFRDLYSLKDKFEVSISALVNRINELRLLYITENKKIYKSREEALGQIAFF